MKTKIKIKIKHFFYNLFSLTLFTINLYSNNQNIYFEHLNNNIGLIDNNISYIYQDSKDAIWINTGFSLNYFDGYNVIKLNLSPDNSPSAIYYSGKQIIEDSQHRLWIASNDGLIMYDNNNNTFKVFKHDQNKKYTVSSNIINNLLIDKVGRLFVSTNNGVNLFHEKLNGFELLNLGTHTHDNITQITQDSNENIWIVKNKQDIIQWETHSNKINNIPNVLLNNEITSIIVSRKNDLWISTNKGFGKLIDSTGKFDFYNKYGGIFDLKEDTEGRIWLATWQDGLCCFNTKDKTFSQFLNNPNDEHSIASNSIYRLLIDKNGILWAGTAGSGVSIYNSKNWIFKLYKKNICYSNSLSDNVTRCFLEDNKGNIWIGTENGGINMLNPKNGKYVTFTNQNKVKSRVNEFILDICQDNIGKIWVGTLSGLHLMNISTKGYKLFSPRPNDSLNSGRQIWIMFKASNGIIWIGSSDGLVKFNPENYQYKIYKKILNNSNSIVSNKIPAICEDNDGNLWIGTKEGLNKFDPVNEKFTLHINKYNDTNSIVNNVIISVLKSINNTIWVISNGGLSKYDPINDRFENYTEKHGFQTNTLIGMLEDDQQNLWISSTLGLIKFNPSVNKIENFYNKNELENNSLLRNAFLKTRNGDMYFGGQKGYHVFNPMNIKKNTNPPKVYISGLKLNNEDVDISTPNTPLKKNISYTNEIVLNYKHRFISIDFIAINYTRPEKNQYAYILEGFDQDWIYCQSRRTAFYTNLPAGKYLFKVKSSNNDGIWNEDGAKLSIVMRPAPWETWWFKVLIFFFLFGTGVAYFLNRTHNIRKRNFELEILINERTKTIEQQKKDLESRAESLNQMNEALKNQNLEIQEMAKKIELAGETKLRYFTNISHEFRTPLTLITGPLEILMYMLKNDIKTVKLFQIIHRNASRLLRLVNQVLDLNKIDSSSMKMFFEKKDVIEYIKELSHIFNFLADKRLIKYTFESNIEKHIAYIDCDKIEKILYNLISNAFKYTHDHGEISVIVSIKNDSEDLVIEVKDTGSGIPAESIPYIFDPFYQVINNANIEKGGTGIGLSLTMEIIKLYKGTINVESNIGKGSSFTVVLPLNKSFFNENEINLNYDEKNNNILAESQLYLNELITESDSELAIENKSSSKPILLLVEDNEDLLQYIKLILVDQYRLIESLDGETAYNMAIDIIPDLIISDIMLPKKDGLSLCQDIKNNEKTSHIPIILLTAQTTEENIINGLELGSDDYIIKPFSPSVLKARVKSLLTNRNKLKEKFQKNSIINFDNTNSSSIDSRFLNKLVSIINVHLKNSNLTIDLIASEMGMSNRNLLRKVKTLTNKTIVEFIKDIQMKKAADLLLKNKNSSISEVCFEVGLTDPSYFTRVFKTHFGMTPSEYIKYYDYDL